MKKTYKIGELAKRFNVNPATLRSWEDRKLLKPARSRFNCRRYSEVDVRKIEQILYGGKHE